MAAQREETMGNAPTGPRRGVLTKVFVCAADSCTVSLHGGSPSCHSGLAEHSAVAAERAIAHTALTFRR